MSVTSPRDFLDAVSSYTSNKNLSKTPPVRAVKIGVVDPNYTSGPAKVTFDGESTLSTNGFAWASTYSPVGGDRVFLLPSGSNSYIIGGKISSAPAYPTQIPLTLAGAWQAFGSPWHTPTVTLTTGNVVKLSGLIKNAPVQTGVWPGTLITTLPSQFCPDTQLAFPGLENANPNTITVFPDGTVYALSTTSTGNYTSLDNVVYSIDPSLVWQETYPYGSGFGPNTGNYIVETLGAYVKDTYGRVWLRGTMYNGGATPGADVTMFTLPSGYAPQYTQHQAASSWGSVNPHWYFTSPLANNGTPYNWKAGSYDVKGCGFAPMHHTATTGWTNISYLNGWTSFDTTSYAPLSYRKDSDGLVSLRGLVKSGTMSAAMGTLPAGFRPASNLLFATPSNAALGRVDIFSDGTIMPSSGSNAYFSVDGICFVAEQ